MLMSLSFTINMPERCCIFYLLPSGFIEAEILTRLPVKSVLRFKSVCKSWNLLISNNPDFVKSHLNLNPNKDSLILVRTKKINYGPDYESQVLKYSRHTKIIGSVNGLVCLTICEEEEFEKIKIAIWNPATKQCLTDIKPFPLRYDDMEHDDSFGFGFDSVANDFKLIYILIIEEQPLEGHIYSCNRHCWTKITPSNFLFLGTVPIFRPPVTFKGSPYWLNLQPSGENLRLAVIWFDVRDEVFRMLPQVGFMVFKQGIMCALMHFRDSIAVMIYNWTLLLTESVDVFVFNERFSVWSKMSIGPFIGKELTLLPSGQRWLQCFKNDNGILFFSSDLVIYHVNLQTHAIKSIKNLGTEGKYCRIVGDCNYSESLVSIQGMKHLVEKEDEVGIFFLNKA